MLNTIMVLVQNKIRETTQRDFSTLDPQFWRNLGTLFPQDCFSYASGERSFSSSPWGENKFLPTQSDSAGIAANEEGRIWGDPHFEGGDGDRFDVQGVAGKTYHLLSDTGLMLNGKFDRASDQKTVVSETGFFLSGKFGITKVSVHARPRAEVLVDGVPLNPGQAMTTNDGGSLSLSLDGKTVSIRTNEGYLVDQIIKKEGNDGELEIRVKTPTQGVAIDQRLPGGLLGQTFDADTTARRRSGLQGEGAILGSVEDYEVPGGIFGDPSSQVAPHAINLQPFYDWANQIGLDLPSNSRFPAINPLTYSPIDWGREISQQNLDSLTRESTRNSVQETLSQDAKINRLAQLMIMALKSGNIALAMLIFSHLEAKTANELTRSLMEKVQKIQEHKRELSQQIQSQPNDAEGSKAIQQIKTEMESANDDLSVLQTFIRDIAQNKQQSLEMANAFLSNEHELNMSIIRSFGK